MFVVEMGTVDMVPRGKELTVITVGTGHAFGEVAFFSRGKRLGSARTREVGRILRIPFDRLEPLLAGNPALAMSFYRNACGFLAKHLRALAVAVSAPDDRFQHPGRANAIGVVFSSTPEKVLA